MDKLVKEKKSCLSASEKKAGEDLIYLKKKFFEKLWFEIIDSSSF